MISRLDSPIQMKINLGNSRTFPAFSGGIAKLANLIAKLADMFGCLSGGLC